MKLRWVLFISVALGCASDDELSCEVLDDPNLCWAQAASAIKACVSDATQPGVLAADRSSCTFDNGSSVNFGEPLPTNTSEVTDLESLSVTFLSANGNECGHFVDTLNNEIRLEGGGHQAIAKLRAGEFSIACDDGPSYATDFDSVFDCAAKGSQVPTDGFDFSHNSVALSIYASTTEPGLGNIFTCESP